MLSETYLMESPIGVLLLRAHGGRLAGVTILPEVEAPSALPAVPTNVLPIFVQAKLELEEYFAGHRMRFEVPCSLDGLPAFTRTVLEALRQVPFGHTLTYGELAAKAGSPRAARAVGRAMAVNPLPIIIPCHRILASGGRIGGYSGGGGVCTKSWLLAHEAAHLSEESREFSRKTA